MNLIELGLYILTVIVMIATPGPVMILVASAGLKGGYWAALRTIFGTNCASLILIALSILLLKGIFQVNENVFLLIKLFGSLYIAYIGYEILKDSLSKKDENVHAIKPKEAGFKKGFFVGLSNPKDIIFFSSFFPQFIGIHSNINISLSILVIVWIILDFLTLSIVYKGFNAISQFSIYKKILMFCAILLFIIAAYGFYTAFIDLIY